MRLFTLTIALVAMGASAATSQAALERAPVANAGSPIIDIRSAGDARLFVADLNGKIHIVRNGALEASPFADLGGVIETGGERGLLSLAFHPQYPAKPYVYVLYTSKAIAGASAGDVRIGRLAVSADPDQLDPASLVTLLTIPHSAAANHNGGQLQFGPDGMLYASVGDGGGGFDSTPPGCNAQRTDSRLGKLLRLDVGQNENTAPYHGIPADNPFTAAGDPLDDIWALGLRNPFRFSFDRATGDLWIADVGQSDREEVDFASRAGGLGKGANYGWKFYEGFLQTSIANSAVLADCPGYPPEPPASAFTPPLLDYGRSQGATVIGGYVVRDPDLPALTGRYLFADAPLGSIRSASPASVAFTEELSNAGYVQTFGEDSAGRLYYGTAAGDVYRLQAPSQTGPTGSTGPAGPSGPAGAAAKSAILGFSAVTRQSIGRRGRVLTTLDVGQPGSRIELIVSSSPTRSPARLGRRVLRGARAGRRVISVQLTAAGARRVRKVHSLKALLLVRVTPPRGRSMTRSVRLALRG